MINPYEWLADRIVAHPRVVGAVAVLVFVVALFGLTLVSMESGEDTYIDKTTSRGALLAHYTDTYQSDAIMIIFESDDILDIQYLNYIEQLQEDLADEQYVVGVSGLCDLLKQGNGGTLPQSSAEVDRIVEQAPPRSSRATCPPA